MSSDKMAANNILVLTVTISLSVWVVDSVETTGKYDVGNEKEEEALNLQELFVLPTNEISKLQAIPYPAINLEKGFLKETEAVFENQSKTLRKKFEQEITQDHKIDGSENVIKIQEETKLNAEPSSKFPDEEKLKIREPRCKNRKGTSGGRRRGGYRRRRY